MACNALLGVTAPCCAPVNRGIAGTANLVDLVTTVAIAAFLVGAFKVEGFKPSPFQVKLLTGYVGVNTLLFAHIGMQSSLQQK